MQQNKSNFLEHNSHQSMTHLTSHTPDKQPQQETKKKEENRQA
jgi:hypothetical protein